MLGPGSAEGDGGCDTSRDVEATGELGELQTTCQHFKMADTRGRRAAAYFERPNEADTCDEATEKADGKLEELLMDLKHVSG